MLTILTFFITIEFKKLNNVLIISIYKAFSCFWNGKREIHLSQAVSLWQFLEFEEQKKRGFCCQAPLLYSVTYCAVVFALIPDVRLPSQM